MSTLTERRALARWMTQEATVASGGIGAIHAAVAGRVFRGMPGSAAVRVWHNAVTRTSYFGVRAGIALAGAVGTAFADGDVHPQLLAAVNAVRGAARARAPGGRGPVRPGGLAARLHPLQHGPPGGRQRRRPRPAAGDLR